ncbi:MAG: CoA-binding protein [Planctomycetota bacterium]
MIDPRIGEFLSGGPFAVVGASKDRTKYGNKVLRAYLQAGKPVYCVHPRETEIEGQTCYRSLADLPETPTGVSIITPPPITEQVVRDAHAKGATWVWMQPGAESPAAIAAAEGLGLRVIAGGPCVLVALRYREPA